MRHTLLIALFFLSFVTLVHAQDAEIPGTNSITGTSAPTPGTTAAEQAARPTGSEAKFVPIAPIPGLTQGAVANSRGLADFLNNLYKYLVGLAAVIAVIEIVWGGFEIATKESVTVKMKGKERIYQALLGLALVLSPVLVFYIINPAILNLSVNLPELDTKSANYQPQVTTRDVQLSDTETKLRESAGGQVIGAFTLTAAEATSATVLGKILDEKQAKCTADTGGRGVILPAPQTGGGAYNFVCQTCPPGTTPNLFGVGQKGSGARGACVKN